MAHLGRIARRTTATIAVLHLALACANGGCSRHTVSEKAVLGYVEGQNIVIEFRLAEQPSDQVALLL